MTILAIETSCDETALALVKANGGLKAPKFKILKNIVLSQVAVHRPFGGVVPKLAKREHEKNLPFVFLRLGKIQKPPDCIAVTVGPGIAPCLWQGIQFARELRKKYFPKTKLVGVNHLQGHLYSFFLTNHKQHILFPAIALIVSGGHTMLLLGRDVVSWKKIGETRDDAAGEVFDKVARMLRIPYPGGPEIEKLARKGNTASVFFPRPMLKTKGYDFSFSGLKTSVLYYLRKTTGENNSFEFRAPKQFVMDVAASFEAAVFDVLSRKTIRAVRVFGARSVLLSGGVAANRHLRNIFRKECRKAGARLIATPPKLCGDNAAMIAVAAYVAHVKKTTLQLKAQPNLTVK